MRICGEGGNFSLRKKVPSLPCNPSLLQKPLILPQESPPGPGPEGFLVEGACRPTLSVMPYPEIFLSASPFARPACAQKQNACTRQAFDIRAVHRRTTMGTGTQFREKYFGDWMGDWGRKDSFYNNAFTFPQPARRQNSRSHFDGRSSSGLHASDDERRHNGFGYRSCSPQASGERITGTPPLLLRMPDPGLYHGASCPCAPAFLVSPVRTPKTKKPAQGRHFDIRAATPATVAQ